MLHAVHSVELAVCNFHRKLFNDHIFLFFSSLLDIYFSNLVAEKLTLPQVFVKICSSKVTIWWTLYMVGKYVIDFL